MSGRVPNKIALPTGSPQQQQQYRPNQVPNQIALPSGGRDPTRPDPPQQLQPQQNTWGPPPTNPSDFQPSNTHISPYQPVNQPPQNGYLPNPPEPVGVYPDVASNYGPYGFQPAVPGQRQSPPEEAIIPPNTAQTDGNNQPAFPPQAPQKELPQEPDPEPEDANLYCKTCNYCRRKRKRCNGARPCGICLVANVVCVYELKAGVKPKDTGRRKRNIEAFAEDRDNGEGSSRNPPPSDNDAAPKRQRTNYHQQQEPQTFSIALHRVRPPYQIPSHGNCDHCAAGGHEGQDCNANHAEQIECSQCTKYRNLVDPNHVCRIGGGEYWQKRFGNSRPAYPMNDPETSCCVACKAKRGGRQCQICDIDIQVKVGCTPCRDEGRLCEAWVERRANGLIPGPPDPWEQMWNRPKPEDGALIPGRRPWWRHVCQRCIPELNGKKSNPCSWVNDVRLEGYKCLNCVEKDRPCVEPFTNQEFANGYIWDGQGDCLIVDAKSANRTGNSKCENCKINRTACRGYEGPLVFACSKCTAWGLTCVVERDGQPVQLPHQDRKAIGWTRNTGDAGHLFMACVPCRINNRNCDRKRPCDSCIKSGSECEAFLDGGARMRRDDRVAGADSADYYMALGYGPGGVDTNRWNVPPHLLVGPNQPKWVNTTTQPTAQQLAAYQRAQEQGVQNPAQDLPPREFGGVEPEDDTQADDLRRNPRRSTRDRKPTEKAKANAAPVPPRPPKPPYTGPKRPRGRPRKRPAPSPVPTPSPARDPSPLENAGGLGYEAFGAANGQLGQESPWNENDSTLLNTPGQGNPFAIFFGDQAPAKAAEIGQDFDKFLGGDNHAASKAVEIGEDFEKWLGDFNDLNAYQQPLQDQMPALFEGQPNLDEVQQIVGGDVVMNDSDAEQLANEMIDPDFLRTVDEVTKEAEEEEEQGRVMAQLRLAVLSFSADQRFVPIELRNHKLPEISPLPDHVAVAAPERFLLQLDDAANGAPPPQPYAGGMPGETEYIQNLRTLLSKWKKPGDNVLKSIPDLPMAESNPLYTVDNHGRTCEEYQVDPVINGDACRNDVADGAVCESLEHMARALPYMVCDACDGRTRMGLFEGCQPLTRGEFLRMRAYACAGCAEREMGAAAFGMPGRPAHPVTGCACAPKLLGRRLCLHHRYRLAKELMVQTMFVSEWAITNYGHRTCLFCKTAPAKTDTGGDFFGSLVYLCLNCQGVVAESNAPHLAAGVELLLGGTVPNSLNEQLWYGVPPDESLDFVM